MTAGVNEERQLGPFGVTNGVFLHSACKSILHSECKIGRVESW